MPIGKVNNPFIKPSIANTMAVILAQFFNLDKPFAMKKPIIALIIKTIPATVNNIPKNPGNSSKALSHPEAFPQ